MKSNLLEAAAEILSKSKSSAPAEPMHKSDADVEDVGGDTPTVHQASNPDATKPIKKATAPGAAPRVGAMPPAKLKEEKDDEDEDEDELDEATARDAEKKNPGLKRANQDLRDLIKKTNDPKKLADLKHLQKNKHKLYEMEDDEDEKEEMKKESYGKTMKEDVESMFEGETISEDFKSKVSTIFEARVHDRVSQIQEELEAQYTQSLEEAIADVTVSMTERVNDYLNYVVEEWMQENAIAIEKGLRTELTEEFIVGLRNLFVENYIDIPDEKVDLVEELSTKVEDLESKLNEQIDISIELVKELNESKKIEAFHTVTEGLTQTQIEKLKTLVESVEFTTEEEFVEKLETIKENYFPSDVKRADESSLHESVEDPDTANSVKISDPRMAVYAQAISRTLVK